MTNILKEAEEKILHHQYADAESLYTQYLAETPSIDMRELLRLVQVKQIKYNEAIDTLYEVGEADETNAHYFANLEKYDLAIQMYMQALSLHHSNADTWVAMAYAFYKSGNLKDADIFYEMAKITGFLSNISLVDKMHMSEKTAELDKVL